MNPRFLPDAEKQARSGIERHHKLVKQSDNMNEGGVTRDAMPGNWRYNESRADQIWDELEVVPVISSDVGYVNDNPFQKIDAVTSRIKKTIANFEVHDQEFLMELLNFMGDESCVEGLDGHSMLSEARQELQTMIDEHVTMSKMQEKLLVGMKEWFANIERSKVEGDGSDYADDHIQQLRGMLDEYTHLREGCVERVEGLHQDMVHNLQGRVTDAQKAILQKDVQISELEQRREVQGRRRTGGLRQGRMTHDHPDYDDELLKAQRRVLELQSQVAGMKKSLTDISKMPDFSGEAVERALAEVNACDFGGEAISVAKEIEFASKLRILQDQIMGLKEDNDLMRTKMSKDKQASMILETKLQTLDRQKKAAEVASQASAKQLDMMKSGYEQQIAALTQGPAYDAGESSIDVTNRYEKKLSEAADNYRKQLADIQESMDKRYKAQLRDIMSATGNGDVLKAFDETVRHSVEGVKQIQEQSESALRDQKQAASRQLMEVSKHYEALLKKKDFDMMRVRDSVEHEVRNKVLEKRIEFDQKTNALVLAATETAATEFARVRNQMTTVIEELKHKLGDVSRERDTLRTIINDNDIASEIADDFVLDADDNDEDDEAKHDDVLQQSLVALKEREVEQKLSEKHGLVLKAQKEMLADSAAWELEQAKVFYKAQYDQALSDMRRELTAKIEVVQGAVPDSTAHLDNLLVDAVEMFGDVQGRVEEDAVPTVPLPEVDTKLNSLKCKLLGLFSNKGIWRQTLRKLKTLDLSTEDDILDAMKHAISLQAVQYDEMKAENSQLKDQLKIKAVGSISQHLSMASLMFTDELLVEDDHKIYLEVADSVVFEVTYQEPVVVHNRPKASRQPPVKPVEVVVTRREEKIGDGQSEPDTNCPRQVTITLAFSSGLGCVVIEGSKCEQLSFEMLQIGDLVSDGVPSPDPLSPPPEGEAEDSAQVMKLQERLNCSTDMNRQLKHRFDQLLKRMSEIEIEYKDKINTMTTEINDLRKIVIDSSMNVVNSARSLPDEPENLSTKMQASIEITRNIEQMNSGRVETETREAIRKLSIAANTLDVSSSCRLADEVLDQTQDVLLMISHESTFFGTGLQQESVSARNRVVKLNETRKMIEELNREMSLMKEFIRAFVESHQGMLANLGSASKNMLITLKNVKSVAQQTVDELVQALEMKVLALDEAEKKVQQQSTVVDDLHTNLRTSVVQLQRLNIEKGQRDDEVEAFIQSQVRSDKYIEQMVGEVNSANRKVMDYQKVTDTYKIALSSGRSLDSGPSSGRGTPVLGFVPPFRIYTTGLDGQPSKGFSLVPRNNATDAEGESESESPAPASRTIPPFLGPVVPIAAPNMVSPDTQLHPTPKTPMEHEKVRVRVGVTQKIAKPGRMVVPKLIASKPRRELPINEGPMSLLPKSISFENLVPLSNEEMQGTLIGYVTRYMPAPTSKPIAEKPPEPRRPPLTQSPLLISEVPLERLRVDSSRPETNEVRDTRPRPKSDAIDALERRLKLMERQLFENVNELQREREKVTRSMEVILDLKTKLARTFRGERKNAQLHEATKKRLGQALSIIGESDREIVRLKKLIKEISGVAGSVTVRENLSSPAIERKKQMAKHFDDESERILNIFRGVSVGVNSMARHEMDAIRRWIPRKEQLIQQQRDKLVASLKAVQHVTDAAADERKPLVLSSIAKIKKPRAITAAGALPLEKPPTFEKATIAARSGQQTLPRALTDGVVGNSISSRSSESNT